MIIKQSRLHSTSYNAPKNTSLALKPFYKPYSPHLSMVMDCRLTGYVAMANYLRVLIDFKYTRNLLIEQRYVFQPNQQY